MSLTLTHRKNIMFGYCIIFYAIMVVKWSGGLFLFQLQPPIFNTPFNFASWVLMGTGIHLWLISNPGYWVWFDFAFYLLPAVYMLAFFVGQKRSHFLAIAMLLVNWLYISCYTLFPTNSIESYIGWLLFPVLFITHQMRSYYFVLQGLRYFFLYIMVSAASWKLVQQGLFNAQQMSGVLLYQHKEMLTSSPDHWLTNAYYWLINHWLVSYWLYLLATLLEAFFIIGFFTSRFDKWLILAFVLFLVADFLVMRIYYWELLPFMLALWYGKYRLPPKRSQL